MENVDWRVGREPSITLRGAGTLQLEPVGDGVEQTVELRLSIDDGVPVLYRAADSMVKESG